MSHNFQGLDQQWATEVQNSTNPSMWKREDISTVKSTSQGCTRARTSDPAQPFDGDKVVGDKKTGTKQTWCLL